ncbi:MAG: hypothetical protein A2681_00535 [Candidatus Liptonbacteria bacterium RIFCSPHIGHO2_01_FULL_56_18b]|nr:MAG: hypothetical protein A2681_00535 [Candidatus Liptonbacteria bacterium RIFCSPHIGHO2_01_FULL_56_18b]
MTDTIWIILGIASLILLAFYWNRRNAVWGGFTIGIIAGLVIALFSGFDWYIVGKGAISGTIIGFGAELLGKISDKMRNRK